MLPAMACRTVTRMRATLEHPPTAPVARRLACLAAAVLAAGALSGCTTSPTHGGPASQAHAAAVRSFDLYVSEAAAYSPLTGHTLPSFAFGLSPNGPFTVPGPEIRVTQGDHIVVRLHSSVHTIHWHGYAVPWAMDGVPYMTQTLGGSGSYTYEFDAKESGTYWYHCHVDAPTHIDVGMYGAFIVDPADPAQDPAFSRDYTLMLAEVDSQMFRTMGTAFMGHQPGSGDVPSNPMDAANGAADDARTAGDIAGVVVGGTTGQYAGSAGPRDYYPQPSLRYRPQYDTFMINGKQFPETQNVTIKSGEAIRIRLINAGQLVHTMHLHGHHFLVTHKDGYNLPMPYKADTLVIGPGERYDIYITGDNPGQWDFHDHGGAWDVGAYAANDHAFPGGMNTMLVYEDWQMPPMPGPHAEAQSAPANPTPAHVGLAHKS